MSAPQQATIHEIAEQLKRTRDSREALRLSGLMREAAHQRAEEIRQTTERLRTVLSATSSARVEVLEDVGSTALSREGTHD